MGHHPKANLLEVRDALDALTSADGVDGRRSTCTARAGTSARSPTTPRFVAGHAGEHGRHRDRHVQRPAARRRPRRRPVRRRPAASRASPTGARRGHARSRLHDRIKVGLPAACDVPFVDPPAWAAGQVDYNGSPAATPPPGEIVNYVDAHDNETLYDALAFKLPPRRRDRPRPHAGARARARWCSARAPASWHAGHRPAALQVARPQLLRLRRLVQPIRWDPAQGNGFGIGLPRRADNADNWPFARPLLADPALVPPPEVDRHVRGTLSRSCSGSAARRRSSGLPTAEEVQRRLSFPLGGPRAPGVIVMCLDGSGLDPRWQRSWWCSTPPSRRRRQTVPGWPACRCVAPGAGRRRRTRCCVPPPRTAAVHGPGAFGGGVRGLGEAGIALRRDPRLDFGGRPRSPADRLRQPSAVTTTSSSIRTPMPRSSAGHQIVLGLEVQARLDRQHVALAQLAVAVALLAGGRAVVHVDAEHVAEAVQRPRRYTVDCPRSSPRPR